MKLVFSSVKKEVEIATRSEIDQFFDKEIPKEEQELKELIRKVKEKKKYLKELRTAKEVSSPNTSSKGGS